MPSVFDPSVEGGVAPTQEATPISPGVRIFDPAAEGPAAPAVPTTQPPSKEPLFATGLTKSLAQLGESQREEALIRDAKINDSLQGDFRPGGFDPTGKDFGTVGRVMDLAKIEDKQAEFSKGFPNGEIRQIPDPDTPGSVVLVARRTPDEPFSLLSERSGGFDPRGRIAPFLAPGGPVINVATAASVAAELFLPFVPGTGVPIRQGFRAGAGAFFGRLGDVGIQKLRDVNSEDAPEIATRMLFEGTFASIFAKLSVGLANTLNKAGPSRSPLRLVPEAAERVQAAAEEGLEPIPLGILVRNPAVRGVLGQAGATSPRPGEAATKMEASLLARVNQRIDELGFGGVGDDELSGAVLALKRQVDKEASDTFGNFLEVMRGRKGQIRAEAGRLGPKSLDNFEEVSLVWKDRKYERAWESDVGISYDLRPQRKGIEAVEREVVAGVRDKKGRLALDPKTGEPLTQTLTPFVGRLRGVIRTFRSLPDIIGKVKDPVTGKISTPIRQLKEIRDDVMSMTVDPSLTPKQRRQAVQVHKLMVDAMDTPLTGGKNLAEFQLKYKAASFANAFREGMLRKTFIQKMMKEDNFEQVVALFEGSGGRELTRFMKRVTPGLTWERMQRGFMTDIYADPKRGLKTLADLETDQVRFDLMIPRNMQPQFRRAVAASARVEETADLFMKQQVEPITKRALALARSQNASLVNDAIKVTGGPDGRLGRSIRAGLYKKVLDESTQTLPTGDKVINPRTLESNIKSLQKLANDNFPGLFTARDFRSMKNWQGYAVGIREIKEGIGGAMMAGEARTGLSGLLVGRFSRGFKAIRTMAGNAGAAMLLLKPVTVDSLATAVKASKPVSSRAFGAVGAAMGTVASDIAFMEGQQDRPIDF